LEIGKRSPRLGIIGTDICGSAKGRFNESQCP
jgi:hypothetical protein